jgi:hypothetical protein
MEKLITSLLHINAFQWDISHLLEDKFEHEWKHQKGVAPPGLGIRALFHWFQG